MIAIGIGSNQGDRIDNIRKTLRLIYSKKILKSIKVSPLYDSQALLPPKAPSQWNIPFLNLVVVGESDLSPQQALKEFKFIESKLSRDSSQKWAPRPIDIDILFWNDMTISDENLIIPHPEFYARPFCLCPLRDLVPFFSPKNNHETLDDIAKKWHPDMPQNTKRNTTRQTQLVGILNITPDSFSDGGKYQDIEVALRQVQSYLDEGCSVLDIGTESTRPGATLIDQHEEWERLENPLRQILLTFPKLEVSIDTRHSQTAAKSLSLGVRFINDVTAFSDKLLIDVVRDIPCDLIFMHSLGVPPKSDECMDSEKDIVEEIKKWAGKKLEMFEKNKISADRLIFDPGIGFGKTALQSFEILNRIDEFRSLGLRILVGHSRKSFLKEIDADSKPSERDCESACVSAELASKGVDYVRVHNISLNRIALDCAALTRGVFL